MLVSVREHRKVVIQRSEFERVRSESWGGEGGEGGWRGEGGGRERAVKCV